MNKRIGPKVLFWYGIVPCMCCIIFGGCHKHNSLPLGPIQPSSPSTKELHDKTISFQSAAGTSCSVEDELTPQTSLEIVSRSSAASVPVRSRSEPDYEAQNDSDSAIMLEDNNFTEVNIFNTLFTMQRKIQHKIDYN